MRAAATACTLAWASAGATASAPMPLAQWLGVALAQPMAQVKAKVAGLRPVACNEAVRAELERRGWRCEREVVESVAAGSVVMRGQMQVDAQGRLAAARLYASVASVGSDAQAFAQALRQCAEVERALDQAYASKKTLSRVLAPTRVNYLAQYGGSPGLVAARLACVQAREPDAMHITVTTVDPER